MSRARIAPFSITRNRYPTKCAETGAAIHIGDLLAYDYSTRKCYCEASRYFAHCRELEMQAANAEDNERAARDRAEREAHELSNERLRERIDALEARLAALEGRTA